MYCNSVHESPFDLRESSSLPEEEILESGDSKAKFFLR